MAATINSWWQAPGPTPIGIPTTETPTTAPRAGLIPPDDLEFLDYELQWFNRWLKGDESAELGHPVKVFVMGGGDGRRGEKDRLNHGGTWQTGEQWPAAGTSPRKYYFHGDGMLSSAVSSWRFRFHHLHL